LFPQAVDDGFEPGVQDEGVPAWVDRFAGGSSPLCGWAQAPRNAAAWSMMRSARLWFTCSSTMIRRTRLVLLTGWPGVRVALGEALDRVASSDTVTRTGRDQVAGLHYALRIADR
jgi:hypothetical protein